MKLFIWILLLTLSIGIGCCIDEDEFIRQLNANGCEAERLSESGELSHSILVNHFRDYPGAMGIIYAKDVSNGMISYWYSQGVTIHQLNISNMGCRTVLDVVGQDLIEDENKAPILYDDNPNFISLPLPENGTMESNQVVVFGG